MSPETLRRHNLHIAVCGTIGVGKTTLVHLLADRLHADSYLEEPEYYPFVEDAFRDPHRWSFANQVQFIVAKTQHQARIAQLSRPAIQEMDAYAAHYIWTPVLSEMGYLDRREATVLQELIELISLSTISLPDLYVMLQASPSTVMPRIIQRDRSYENRAQMINILLELLDKSVQRFADHSVSATLWLSAEAVDLRQDNQEREALIQRIITHLGPRLP